MMLSVDVMIIHQGHTKLLEGETVWVWDMGSDILLCHAVIQEESLSLAPILPEDEVLVAQHVTRSGDFQLGEGDSLLLEHLRERSRQTLVASLSTVAQLPPPPGHRMHPERQALLASAANPEVGHRHCPFGASGNQCCPSCRATLSSVEQDQKEQDLQDEGVLRDSLRERVSAPSGTTHSRFDGMKFEEVLELRRSLLHQLRTPVEDLRRRLEEIKALYPEAFSDTVETPCKLRKFEIRLKDNFRYYCFLPRRVSDPVLQEMKLQIAELLKQGVIQECHDSPWAFPIVMARRPGSDKLRLCIDYVLQN